MNLPTDDPITRRLLWLIHSACIALLTVVTLSAWFDGDHFWIIWLIQSLPLILLLPGLIQKHYRSYSWLCFIMLMYFTNYVVQVYSPSRGLMDYMGLVLTVIIFIASMYASRRLQRLFKSTLSN
ncbi:MAG: DUF2069 domain-containing protein [Pseudomonadota bacterium]